MTNKDKEFIAKMLIKESQERIGKCKADCHNCGFGVMVGEGHTYDCAMDIVAENFERELYIEGILR